jgi:hypothetical protein
MRAMRAAAPPAVGATPSLSDLKVYELKAICRAKGLKVAGRKLDLIDRICEADSAAVAVSAAEPAARSSRGDRAMPALLLRQPSALPTRVELASERGEGFSHAALELAYPSGLAQEAVHRADGVDVLSAEESLEQQLIERKAQRRRRLQSYFAEEMDKISEDIGDRSPAGASADQLAGRLFASPYSSEFQSLRSQAGDSYSQAMIAAADDRAVPIGGTGTSIRYALPLADAPQLPAGSARAGRFRMAWCREYEPASGTTDGEIGAGGGVGVLVDLQTQSEFAIRGEQLRIADETVPRALVCLYRGEFVEYELADESDGAQPRVACVQGIHGWPLMCEAAHMLDWQQQQARGSARRAPRT